MISGIDCIEPPNQPSSIYKPPTRDIYIYRFIYYDLFFAVGFATAGTSPRSYSISISLAGLQNPAALRVLQSMTAGHERAHFPAAWLRLLGECKPPSQHENQSNQFNPQAWAAANFMKNKQGLCFNMT